MQGLRTKETIKFQKFFSIVQDAAEKQNSVFFLDAGDGNEFETETLEGEDLMGWLIPQSRIVEFEKEWRNGDISDDWSDFYVWALWKDATDPIITFE